MVKRESSPYGKLNPGCPGLYDSINRWFKVTSYIKSRSSWLSRRDLWNVGVLPQHWCSLHPEDWGSMDLRNVGILPQHYMASQPGRPRLESLSPPWKPQNSHQTVLPSTEAVRHLKQCTCYGICRIACLFVAKLGEPNSEEENVMIYFRILSKSIPKSAENNEKCNCKPLLWFIILSTHKQATYITINSLKWLRHVGRPITSM